MPLWFKRNGRSDFVDQRSHTVLMRLWDLDVLDRFAVGADQMVMVSKEPFGQLIASYAPGAMVRDQNARLFEDRQGSIER